MSRLGTNSLLPLNSRQMINRKNTSSLVNQVLNKNVKSQKKLLTNHGFKKGNKK